MNARTCAFVAVSALAALVAGLLPASAGAAFPGRNGSIAFSTSSLVDGAHSIDIWGVEPDGQNFRRITFGSSAEVDPAWSPNGRWIAFSRTPQSCFPRCSGGGEIWIARADGAGERQVTSGAVHDIAPAWSPDGKQLVFARAAGPRDEFDYDFDLHVVNTDGTGLAKLVSQPLRSEYDPAWSPDGTRIAFATDRFARCPRPCPQIDLGIRSVRSDGTDDRPVVDVPRASIQDPDWSPDGGRIAYTNGHQNSTVQADGTDVRAIPNGPLGLLRTNPAWSPDGTRIAYGGHQVGHTGLDGSSNVTLWSGTGVVSWQPPGPRPEDFKNRPAFCRAERKFVGEEEFAAQYGNFGGCVSAGR